MKLVTKLTLMAATALAPAAAMAQNTASTGEGVSRAPVVANEIVITARKKEESLQDAPVTVAVATAETIEQLNLQDLSDISKTTAGFSFDNEFGRTSNRPVIRGQANILGESGVATFIDGIYVTGSIADYDVEIIERVEIVKGPQSALYGRNTYSGAINVITKSPGENFGGTIKADVAQDDRYELTAFVEAPLAEGLGVAISGRYYNFGGEFENQFNDTPIGGEETWSVSGILGYENGPLSMRLRGYYSESDDDQPAFFQQGAEENNCLFDNGALYEGAGRYFCGTIQPQPIAIDGNDQFAINDLGDEVNTLNTSLRIDYELSDQLTLTSLTGYNDRSVETRLDADYSVGRFQTAVFTPGGFPAGAPIGFGPAGPIFPKGFVGTTVDFSFEGETETKDWSQELRLTYADGPMNILIGGYYFDQSIDGRDTRQVPDDAGAIAGQTFGVAVAEQQALCAADPTCASIVPFFGPSTPNSRNINNLDIENWAVFGRASVDVTDRLSLSVEARYAEETIEQAVFDVDEGDELPAAITARAKFTSFSPRVTVNYDLTENNLLYAVYAEGTKPGGFNGAAAIDGGAPSFDEEEATSYEVGLKNVFGGGQFILNLAGFYNDIEGYQLSQNVRSGANQVSATTNAGDARIVGLEIEAVARPTRALTITGNLTLLDPKFNGGFDENQGVLNDVADDGLVNCSTGDEFPDDACQSAFGSIDGKQIPRTSEYTAFVDVDYTAPIGEGNWLFFAGSSLSYQSTRFAQVHNLAETGDATLVNARLGVENDMFRIQVYGNNLFDEDSVPLVLRYADGNNSFRRSFVGIRRRGQHFGVAGTMRF